MCTADILKPLTLIHVFSPKVLAQVFNMAGTVLVLALRVRGDTSLKEVQAIQEGEVFIRAVPSTGAECGDSQQNFPELLAPHERFLHSHSFGVSHLREICPSLLAQDMPVTSCGPGSLPGGWRQPPVSALPAPSSPPRAAEPQTLAGNERAHYLQADMLGSEMGRHIPEAPQ